MIDIILEVMASKFQQRNVTELMSKRVVVVNEKESLQCRQNAIMISKAVTRLEIRFKISSSSTIMIKPARIYSHYEFKLINGFQLLERGRSVLACLEEGKRPRWHDARVGTWT